LKTGDASLAFISDFQPGSIKSVDDLVTALELTLGDLFRRVGFCYGRSDNVIQFEVHEEDVPEDVEVPHFAIVVMKHAEWFDMVERDERRYQPSGVPSAN
jgi:hypothetical protein